MTAEESSIVESAVQRLKTDLHPLRIYLFGSRATDTAVADSDYDLLTVVPQSNMPRYKRAQHARGLLAGIDASFDVIVLTVDEWTRQLKSGISLSNQVLNEGRLLHESGT
jgi:predicted nucleotidyltransferase